MHVQSEYLSTQVYRGDAFSSDKITNKTWNLTRNCFLWHCLELHWYTMLFDVGIINRMERLIAVIMKRSEQLKWKIYCIARILYRSFTFAWHEYIKNALTIWTSFYLNYNATVLVNTGIFNVTKVRTWPRRRREDLYQDFGQLFATNLPHKIMNLISIDLLLV